MVTLSFTPVPVLQSSCSFQLFVTGAIYDGFPMATNFQQFERNTLQNQTSNVLLQSSELRAFL